MDCCNLESKVSNRSRGKPTVTNSYPEKKIDDPHQLWKMDLWCNCTYSNHCISAIIHTNGLQCTLILRLGVNSALFVPELMYLNVWACATSAWLLDKNLYSTSTKQPISIQKNVYICQNCCTLHRSCSFHQAINTLLPFENSTWSIEWSETMSERRSERTKGDWFGLSRGAGKDTSPYATPL